MIKIITAGPASNTVPFNRYPMKRPTHYGPRDVFIMRMAQRDIDRLDPGQRRLTEQAIEDLRQGRARVEPKERPPLIGSYTVRVTGSLRMGIYLTRDQPTTPDPHPDWVVYWVGNHNYNIAEQRMRNNPGYTYEGSL